MVTQNIELINGLLLLLAAHRAVFSQERVYLRAIALVFGEVFAFKEHRITDLLRALGLVEEDWGAWYRLFQKPQRFLAEQAGQVLLKQTLVHVKPSEVYVVGGDCTQVARDSQKLEGSSWLKCARNPPWRVGIHRGQRFFNGSWLTPLSEGFSRAIPLQWRAAFPEKAVLKAHESCKEHLAGLAFIQWVRQHLDAQGRTEQAILYVVDGSYDKPDFWKGLPHHVTALVRTAKNRALFYVPGPYAGKGRRRLYGEQAPAPQAYLKQRAGWRSTQVKVRGHQRRVVYRVEGPFLRKTMPDHPVFLICVRGQSWQKAGQRKRRQPCFYCVNALQRDGHYTLPLDLTLLLTWAWQRWELEVVHREVKALWGLGDKQCHHPLAAIASVQWSAWVYALLMLAAYRAYALPTPPTATPAWYRHPTRWTLSSYLDALRAALWSDARFQPLLTPSPKNWPKLEAQLEIILYSTRDPLFFPT